ncbi:hypothetical protein ES708_26879 [subsurface metagenome]
MEPILRYKKGDFNTCDIVEQPDGSYIYSLTKDGERKPIKFRAKNLYQPNEQEVNIDTGKPIAKRDIRKAVPKVSEKAKEPSERQGS